jgi:GNAT superfamily N-acetyltransferase
LPSNAHLQQVQGLLVDPGVRGRGIGRALLDEAVDLARRRRDGGGASPVVTGDAPPTAPRLS